MSMNIDFLSPRFVGKRFEGHSIPLGVLKDLAVLDEMVSEAAKWLYLKEHSEKNRVPKGFTNGISIKLTDIGEGSAIPKLILVISTSVISLFPSENQQYYEKAREHIIGAIDAAEHNEDISTHLPDFLLGYFDRIGRSLEDDESIEFRPSNAKRPARLNKVTRKTLILASSQIQEYSEEVEIKGFVPEADQDKQSFTISKIDGQKISAPLDAINRETVLKAFNLYQKKQKIIIKGVGLYNRNGKLLKIESIEHISLIDPLDISERLAELALLEKGWLNGLGEAPAKQELTWLEETFDCNYNDSLPLPRLFPTPEGGIQAEWTLTNWEISLEVDLKNRKGELQAVNITANSEVEKTYDLTNIESWKSINEIIKNSAEAKV